MFENLFNPDNPVLSFVNKVVDVLFINILFTLCCLPIFTIGPAMAGLYYCMVKVIRRERGSAAKEFFRGFRENFKQGVVVHLILLAFAAMMFVADLPVIITFLDTQKIENVMTLVFFGLKALLLAGFTCWIYPLMTRFSQKLLKLAEFSIGLMIRYILVTIISVLIFIGAIVIILAEPLYLAIVPGVAALLISLPMEKVLRQVCDTADISDEEDVDTWYLE